MRKTAFLLSALLLAAACLSRPAHADVITYFDFNSGSLGSSGGVRSSTIGSNFGGDIDTNGEGTDINGAGLTLAPGNALTVYNTNFSSEPSEVFGNQGKYIEFAVDTTNYKDLTVSFATRRVDDFGDEGFNNNTFQYSSDGSTFFDFSPSYNPTTDITYTSGGLQTFDLTSFTDLNDNGLTTFRVLFGGGSTSNTSTANLIDNIALTGTQISAVPTPEPSSWAMMLLGGGCLIVVMRRRQKKEMPVAVPANVTG